MYCSIVFESKENLDGIIFKGGYRNCREQMIEFIGKYISAKTGNIKDINNYIYKPGFRPTDVKVKEFGSFYITYEGDKYFVQEKIKNHGWFSNEVLILKHMTVFIVKTGKFEYKEYRDRDRVNFDKFYGKQFLMCLKKIKKKRILKAVNQLKVLK